MVVYWQQWNDENHEFGNIERLFIVYIDLNHLSVSSFEFISIKCDDNKVEYVLWNGFAIIFYVNVVKQTFFVQQNSCDRY